MEGIIIFLPPNFRLTDLHIVDPYDSIHNILIHKRHFRYDVLWDTTCNTSLVKMFLTSGRGTFSFVLAGTAKVFDPSQTNNYVPVRESEYVVSEILEHHIISREMRDTVTDDIAGKSEWLELKPNFMGIGINLNKIIQDSIKAFRRKIKPKE